MSGATWTQVSALVPYIIGDTLDYAKEQLFMPNLVTTFTDMTGMQPRAFRINPSGGTVWNNAGETVDLTGQTFDYTALGTITPKEVAYRIDVYDQRLATDMSNGIDTAVDVADEFGYKLMRQIELDLIANFSAFTGGTVWAGSAASTAGTMTWGNLYAARAQLIKNKIRPPYVAVIDSYHYHYLAIAANIAGLSNAGYLTFRDEIQRQYQVRQVDADFYLYITPNIGTNTVARNFNGVFNAQALGLDLRRGLRIAPQRDESARLLELNATIWYGAGLIQPTFGIQIIGTVLSAPNN